MDVSENDGGNLIQDVGRLLEIIFRQWQAIISAVLICSITSALVALVLPKSYVASVLVASTKSYANVSFGSTIQTYSEEDLLSILGLGASTLFDRKARLQSYLELVANPTIAQVILDKLGDRLQEEERSVPELLRMVQGELAANSDSIRIVVTYRDPQVAADIANAWGDAYVKQVNDIYAGSETSQTLNAISQQVVAAKSAYDLAQQSWVGFVTNNQIDELNRQVAETQVIINSLSTARETAIQVVVDDLTGAELDVISEYSRIASQNQLLAIRRDQQGRSDLITTYINTLLVARQMVFDESANRILSQLSKDYSQLRQNEYLLEDASDMLAQVRLGGQGAASSNALALTLLKAQVFASNGELVNLQIQTIPAEISAEAMIADLQGLVATLTERKTLLEKDIVTLSNQLIQGEGFEYLDISLDDGGELGAAIENRYKELWQTGSLTELSLTILDQGTSLQEEVLRRAQGLLELQGIEEILNFNVVGTPLDLKIQELHQQVRNLQAEIATQKFQEQELTRARDLAWDTYNNLAKKQAEMEVAAQTANAEVVLSAPATAPDEDTASGVMIVLVGLVAGGVLGLVVAFGAEFWWVYKEIPPKPFVNLFRRRQK